LLTGVSAAQGSFSIFGAIAATTAGSLVGAGFLYLIGWWVSEERIRHLVERFGKFIGFRTKDFDKAVTWFERHGIQVVLFGRLIPVVRSLVSIPAGLTRMSPLKFFAFTGLGSLVWNSAWISAGYVLGENWEVAERFSSIIDYVVYAVLAFICIQLLIRFLKAGKNS
jgi:membrane protein DedA with SNARE-associated domain